MFKNHDSMTSKMLHWPFRMCGIIGKDHFMTAHSMRGRLSYVLCQLIFIGLSTMAMGLFWNYYWVSIAFMIGVLYIVIQNGASFSAHQFAKFVWKELSQKQKNLKNPIEFYLRPPFNTIFFFDAGNPTQTQLITLITIEISRQDKSKFGIRYNVTNFSVVCTVFIFPSLIHQLQKYFRQRPKIRN